MNGDTLNGLDKKNQEGKVMPTCGASRPLFESILMRAGPGWPLTSD